MRRKKSVAKLILTLGVIFGLSMVVYTFSMTGPITIGSDLTGAYKASMDPMPSLFPPTSATPHYYEPTYADIVTYIRSINDVAVANKRGPRLTDAEIRHIITAVERYSVLYGVNKYTLLAMMSVESSFIIKVPSHLGALYGRGLLQVSEIALSDFNSWNGKEYTVDDLYSIEKNIEVGVWAFNQNYYYGVETDFEHGAIIAYNVGANDYKKHKKDLLDQKFKGYDYDYLEKVQREYDTLMGQGLVR